MAHSYDLCPGSCKAAQRAFDPLVIGLYKVRSSEERVYILIGGTADLVDHVHDAWMGASDYDHKPLVCPYGKGYLVREVIAVVLGGPKSLVFDLIGVGVGMAISLCMLKEDKNE